MRNCATLSRKSAKDKWLIWAAVFIKKRLDENRYRSIILAHSGHFWVYEFLFAKSDQANIDESELMAFRTQVKA